MKYLPFFNLASTSTLLCTRVSSSKNYLKRCIFILNLQISFSFYMFPAVSTSMPQFHHMMGERLRSVEQGADTVVWLALSRAAARTRSGQFFQGEPHRVWQVLPPHIQSRSFPFPFHPLGRIQTSSSPAGITCSDRLFVLQIAGLLRPTCLWPGPAALQRRSRVSWVSWRLWRSESFSRSPMESSTDRPDLSLSELWRKCYTACHSPIKATITWMKVSFIWYV